MKKNVSSQTLANLIGTILLAVIGFIITRNLVVNLSEEMYGQYSLMNNIFTFSMMMTSLGLPAVIGRYIPEYYNNMQYARTKKILIYSYLAKVLLLFIVFMLFLAFYNYMHGNIGNIEFLKDHIFIVLSLCTIINLNALFKSVIESLIMQRTLKFLMVLSKMSFLLGIIFYVNADTSDFRRLLVIWLNAEIILFIPALFVQLRKIFLKKDKVSSSGRISRYNEMFKYGIYAYFTYGFGVFLDVAVDNFVISYYLGNSFVGMYSFYHTFNTYLISFSAPMILLPILIPLVIKKYTFDYKPEIIKRYFIFFIKVILCFALPFFIFAFVNIKSIVLYVFEGSFLDGLFTAKIILIFGFFKLFAYSLDLVWRPLAKSNIVLYSILPFSILNLILDIILVPILGISGAAVATGFSTLMVFIIQYILLKKYITISLDFKNLLPNSFIVNIIILIITCVTFKDLIDSLSVLIIVGIISALIYCVILYKYSPFSTSEKETIKNLTFIKRNK